LDKSSLDKFDDALRHIHFGIQPEQMPGLTTRDQELWVLPDLMHLLSAKPAMSNFNAD
jgi:hypothetical protein